MASFPLRRALAIFACCSEVWCSQGHEARGPGPTSYVAAVVEYAPFMNDANFSAPAVAKIKCLNAEKYLDLAAQASSRGAQIIVFPEYGLFGPVLRSRSDAESYAEVLPDVGECIEGPTFSEALHILKRAAELSRAILVVHLAEQQGPHVLSTQLALSPAGCVMGKYHKFHLYGEPYFDQTEQPEVSTFDTAFGVRFGMFICFDIMFGAPEQTAVERGVTDFVFSSWWVNFPPLLLATQMQSAWAATSQVNLLAANSGAHGYRSSGSGIYGFAGSETDSSGGPVQRDVFFNSSQLPGTGVVLVERLHTQRRDFRIAPRPHRHLDLSDDTMKVSITPLAVAPDQTLHAQVEGAECFARLELAASVPEQGITWSLVAASGLYHGLFHLDLCAIVPCRRLDASCIDSLGALTPSLSLIGAMSLTGVFAPEGTAYSFATRSDGLLVPVQSRVRPNTSSISMAGPLENLYSAAVVNRVFQNSSSSFRRAPSKEVLTTDLSIAQAWPLYLM